jgi:hypothetical protein
LLAAAALAGGCRGDYPLEPTICDDWCREVDERNCGYLDPAECVAGCEIEIKDTQAKCLEELRVVVDCFKASDFSYRCDVPLSADEQIEIPCVEEGMVLDQCRSLNRPADEGDFRREG